MTEHTHVREAGVHYVDTETCVHRDPAYVTTIEAPGTGLPMDLTICAVQCGLQPQHVVAGLPSCGQHVEWVISNEHSRGNPDPVVRRWV